MNLYEMLLANALGESGGGGGGGSSDLDIILAKTTITIADADNAYPSTAPLIPIVENQLYIIQFEYNDVVYQIGANSYATEIGGSWDRNYVDYYQSEDDSNWYLDLPIGGTYTDFTIFKCPTA